MSTEGYKANRACAKRSIAESKNDDTIEYCFTFTASSHHRHSSHYRGIAQMTQTTRDLSIQYITSQWVIYMYQREINLIIFRLVKC